MNAIKSIRERLGLSQEALAKGLSCTQGNVGHYERGQELPAGRAKTLIEYASVHGLDLTMGMVYGLEPLPSVRPASAIDNEQAKASA